MSRFDRSRCTQSELACAYALKVLPASEVAAAEAHIAACKILLQRCRRTQHIGGPVDQPIDDWPQVLHLALAIRAGSDMGFGRGNLARR